MKQTYKHEMYQIIMPHDDWWKYALLIFRKTMDSF